ncbi:MAG: amino acid-binding protein [Nevskiaceae bacterium]|nr:MAG: amino acid-binding protein [Nevskiaceae bacterium]TBR71574.1 MAG: amino acid-binding protein [Nevskiaceae bacterium]
MPTTDPLLSISVLAPPRPRLAMELLRAINKRGGEIEDCRIVPIGDLVSANIVVSGNWSALGRLETALPGIATELECQIRFQRCKPREPAPEYRPYAVDVTAPQQPALLVHVLEFFDGQDVQVAEMSTQKYDSSYTSAGMYNVQMVVHVPVNQHPQALRESFMDLCDDLNADGMLDPIKN